MLRRHAHAGAEDRWGRSWAVRGTSRSRVVLRTSPAKADPRVANGVALHLVDGHLGGVTLHELDETTSLAWRNLDIGDFAKALEERAELVLGDVPTEAADKDSGVVGVRKLIHGLRSTVVAHRRSTHGVHAHTRTATLLHVHTAGAAGSTALVLGSRGADAHRPITAVNALHLSEGLLLVLLVGETNESVTTRHAADGVGHDLSRLGGGVLVLEELDEDKLGDLRAKVSNEDGVLRATLIAAVATLAFLGPCAKSLHQNAHLRSARPPPEAQLSLKGRLELGMSCPLRLRAFDAASGLAKSTKQYPALLLHKLVCMTRHV